MSASLNCSVLPKIPPHVEALRETVTGKFQTTIDNLDELAKQSGSAQFVQDAKAAADITAKLKDMVLKNLGDEGDTVGNEGTVMSAYTAGKKIESAVGGEI